MKEVGGRSYEGFKVITTGHWIFAALFVVAFIGILLWSYRKDRPIIKSYYNKSIYFILAVIVALFLMFVFRQSIRGDVKKSGQEMQTDSIK